MKFMKLGSKPDCYQIDGTNVRYLATELASDIVVNVGDMKFFLHKFPLLCKCAKFQELVACANEDDEEIHFHDIPGGAAGFELCIKFCYGMILTLNANNVVMARCAAEFLGMHESVEQGNLIYKIDVFLDLSIFHSWKDSITVLKSTKSFLPLAEFAQRCVDSISEMASTDSSKVNWSFTYNKKTVYAFRNLRDNGDSNLVPRDWWTEDLSELDVDLYKTVISKMKSKKKVSDYVIGEALRVYAFRNLKGFGRGNTQYVNIQENRSLVDSIVWMFPTRNDSVASCFLLKLLKEAIALNSDEDVRQELIRKIARQLEEATVTDIMIRSEASESSTTVYDVDIVIEIVKAYLAKGNKTEGDELKCFDSGMISESSKLTVAKLIDEYLTEISKDQFLEVSKFIALAELVSDFHRASHDRLYKAIDTYLKEHPDIKKDDRKSICNLMDCRALSSDASLHAVQNERLPLRTAVQVLIFEQAKATTASACATPNLHSKSLRSLATNSENQDNEELQALKTELAKLKLASRRRGYNDNNIVNSGSFSKFKNMFLTTKIMDKLQHSRSRRADNSTGSSSSERSPFNKR